MPDRISDALRGRREFKYIVVSIDHEFCNVDLFQGIPNAVGRGEEIESGGFTVDVTKGGEGRR